MLSDVLGLVQDDSLALPATGRGNADVHARTAASEETPMRGGTAMAEEGNGPAGQDGGHVAAAAGEPAVADRVDAPKNAMKPAGADPALNRLGRETEVGQLPVRHDAVLTSGKVGDKALDLTFRSHIDWKVRFGGHRRLRAETV